MIEDKMRGDEMQNIQENGLHETRRNEEIDLPRTDKAELMDRLWKALPTLLAAVNATEDSLWERAGISKQRVRRLSIDPRCLKWSEFLSILFILWSNEALRPAIEAAGIFPPELKRALSQVRSLR